MSRVGGSPNILLIIADDLGEDVVQITGGSSNRVMEVVNYEGATEIRGSLPNISLFLRNGLHFHQTWAQPACSPTRASIYAGLHPWKSGVGSPGNPAPELLGSVVTLPEILPSGYACGLFGKWHLGSLNAAGTLPTDHGWDKFHGTLGGVVNDYEDWYPVDSASGYAQPATPSNDEATWVTARETAAWINGLDPDTPWFATVAFHAPHDPFHVPHSTIIGGGAFGIGFDAGTAGTPGSDERNFNLMVQNMDHHIGRLIGSVSGGIVPGLDFDPISSAQLDNTVIIFIGDNGSYRDIATEEEKTTIYEGGVRVPMLVADGRAVLQEMLQFGISPLHLAGTKLNLTTFHLAHVVDLYKTIVRFADPTASGFPGNSDSQDLTPFLTEPAPQLPIRAYNFSQWFSNTGKRATIRNLGYKLNYDEAAGTEPYSLYRYSGREVPGREDDGTAVDLLDEAVSGADADALDNLNQLVDELLANYQLTPSEPFPTPAFRTRPPRPRRPRREARSV